MTQIKAGVLGLITFARHKTIVESFRESFPQALGASNGAMDLLGTVCFSIFLISFTR